MIDRCDDKWLCIFPMVKNSWTEERENPVREQTPSECVDVRSGIHVEERNRSFLIICEHSHGLWLLLESKQDGGGVQSSVLTAVPQTHRPVAVLRG